MYMFINMIITFSIFPSLLIKMYHNSNKYSNNYEIILIGFASLLAEENILD